MNSRVVRGAVIGIESNPCFEAAPGGVAVHGDGAAAGDVVGGGADAGGVLPEHGRRRDLLDLLDPRLRGGGGSLAGGVGARAAERARKALQKLERQGRPST